MAAALPLNRLLSQQLLTKSARSFTRHASNTVLRVSCQCTAINQRQYSVVNHANFAGLFIRVRGYATATATTKKSPAKSKARKPLAKKTPAKPAKTKPIKKVKPKVDKEAAQKKALALKKKKADKALRVAALLDKPKQLPAQAFQVLLVQEAGKGTVMSKVARACSDKYKSLSPEERESLNHTANTNKEKNQAEYKKWVESHTPLEIKAANNARRKLRREAKAAGSKKTFPLIQDDRAVKRNRTPYNYFTSARRASGDFQGLSAPEALKLIGKEWKELSDTAKQRYIDEASADKSRYEEEFKTVYGTSPSNTKPSKT